MKPADSQPSHILPEGTRLPNNYTVNKILGEGGFGITYSGTLTITGEKVAIKEYFPNGLAHRDYKPDGSYSVVPFYGMEDAFEKGRRHFLNEASILKEFQNLNSIVSVKDVIESNGTAYLVMEYIDGITLKQYVKENGALSFQELLPLITPVIQSLIQVHKHGLIHRDISPENLMIGIDNQLHLIDFGAASIENHHDSKSVTIMLKSGYAPPEQYLDDGKQGAWTDIYALCATMYMALTGFAPTDSIRRIQQDELPSLAAHADISSWQAASIEKGMSLTAADRFQNMESLYQALVIPPLERNSLRAAYMENSIENNKTIMGASHNNRHQKMLLFSGIGITGILLCTLILTAVFNQSTRSVPVSFSTGTEASQILQNMGKQITTIENNIVQTKAAADKETSQQKDNGDKTSNQTNDAADENTTETNTGNSTGSSAKNNSTTSGNSSGKEDGYSVDSLEEDEYTTIPLK
ncbi:MAG: protein kinase [Lachnospiraceae bacterium]